MSLQIYTADLTLPISVEGSIPLWDMRAACVRAFWLVYCDIPFGDGSPTFMDKPMRKRCKYTRNAVTAEAPLQPIVCFGESLKSISYFFQSPHKKTVILLFIWQTEQLSSFYIWPTVIGFTDLFDPFSLLWKR